MNTQKLFFYVKDTPSFSIHIAIVQSHYMHFYDWLVPFVYRIFSILADFDSFLTLLYIEFFPFLRTLILF